MQKFVVRMTLKWMLLTIVSTDFATVRRKLNFVIKTDFLIVFS